MKITDIYEVNYMRNEIAYCGTLRNAKRFNIKDDVFVAIGYEGKIFRATIIGVELPPDQNPTYRYKVRIPGRILKKDKRDVYNNLTCESIFNTVEEAKESAKQNLEYMYKRQGEEIERYFGQFDTK